VVSRTACPRCIRDCGVVEHHVEPPESGLRRPVTCRLDVSSLRTSQRTPVALPPAWLTKSTSLRERLLVDVGTYHSGALAGEAAAPKRGRRTETGAGNYRTVLSPSSIEVSPTWLHIEAYGVDGAPRSCADAGQGRRPTRVLGQDVHELQDVRLLVEAEHQFLDTTITGAALGACVRDTAGTLHGSVRCSADTRDCRASCPDA